VEGARRAITRRDAHGPRAGSSVVQEGIELVTVPEDAHLAEERPICYHWIQIEGAGGVAPASPFYCSTEFQVVLKAR